MRFLLANVIGALLALASVSPVGAFEEKRAVNVFNRFQKRQQAHRERSQVADQPPAQPRLQKRASPFLNSNTQKFVVNGTAIPDVNWDVGESYAGLMPISSDPNESRQLYFWFFPSTNVDAKNEIAIWLAGGPGCSAMSSLMTEMGPLTWMAGTFAPTPNPYSWHNLTNMVWVEQPVGVGYTQGVPNITNEEELGQQMVGFWKNFVDAFGMQGYKTYIAGESYAGMFVPYVADAFISQNDDQYYNLAGININDPVIGDNTNQQDTIIANFVDHWENLFFFNQSFKDNLHSTAASCGYTDYMNKYLTFPPPAGPFPTLADPLTSQNTTCDLWDTVLSAATEVNPCFNLYHISEMCPHLWSEMGKVNAQDYVPPGSDVYFNRSDVQRALNAPVGTNWMQCTDINVFANAPERTTDFNTSDTSPGPALVGVLQRVIEHTNNTVIGSGNLDMILPTNGTLLAIQNMTWNGAQGFQEYPGKELNIPAHVEENQGALAGTGTLGSWGSERGLTFYQVQLSGHFVPGHAAGVGYRSMEVLLGRVPDFGTRSTFTTQAQEYIGKFPMARGLQAEVGGMEQLESF